MKKIVFLIGLLFCSNVYGNDAFVHTKNNCKINVEKEDFFELSDISISDISAEWTGECIDGYIDGSGVLELKNGNIIILKQDFGKNKGVYFDRGNSKTNNLSPIPIARNIVFSPCIDDALNAGWTNVSFKEDVNLKSKKWLESFLSRMEVWFNKSCSMPSNKEGRFFLFISTNVINYNETRKHPSNKLSIIVKVERLDGMYVELSFNEKSIKLERDDYASYIMSNNSAVRVAQAKKNKIEREKIELERFEMVRSEIRDIDNLSDKEVLEKCENHNYENKKIIEYLSAKCNNVLVKQNEALRAKQEAQAVQDKMRRAKAEMKRVAAAKREIDELNKIPVLEIIKICEEGISGTEVRIKYLNQRCNDIINENLKEVENFDSNYIDMSNRRMKENEPKYNKIDIDCYAMVASAAAVVRLILDKNKIRDDQSEEYYYAQIGFLREFKKSVALNDDNFNLEVDKRIEYYSMNLEDLSKDNAEKLKKCTLHINRN